MELFKKLKNLKCRVESHLIIDHRVLPALLNIGVGREVIDHIEIFFGENNFHKIRVKDINLSKFKPRLSNKMSDVFNSA